MLKTKKTKKMHPSKGWSKMSPPEGGRERTIMLKKCGKKCFLGPNKSFPICASGTCKINKKGLMSAYIRARQWGKPIKTYKGISRPRLSRDVYKRIANKSKKMLYSFK